MGHKDETHVAHEVVKKVVLSRGIKRKQPVLFKRLKEFERDAGRSLVKGDSHMTIESKITFAADLADCSLVVMFVVPTFGKSFVLTIGSSVHETVMLPTTCVDALNGIATKLKQLTL